MLLPGMASLRRDYGALPVISSCRNPNSPLFSHIFFPAGFAGFPGVARSGTKRYTQCHPKILTLQALWWEKAKIGFFAIIS
jgi:hypothetical protein